MKRIVIIDQVEKAKEEICDKYCKYPEQWDEEEKGETLEDAICRECPLNKI